MSILSDAAHFSALVSMDKEIQYVDNHPSGPPAAIPLVDFEHNILPLQFVIDPGEEVFQKELPFSNEMVKHLTLTQSDKLKLLNQYFDVTYIQDKTEPEIICANKLDKTDKRNGKLTVIEKSRTLPSSFESDDSSSDAPSASSVGGGLSRAKAFSSKAAKQLLMITKHFGSLGRMSKRIKKNLGTFAKRGTSFRIKKKVLPSEKTDTNDTKANQNSSDLTKDIDCETDSNSVCNIDSNTIIAALLHTDRRHIYYDEMIRNYLNTARARFLRQNKDKKSNQSSTNSSTHTSNSNSTVDTTSITPCVNTGCKMFGTSQNNYLCSTCFAEQKQQLNDCRTSPQIINSNQNKKEFDLDSHSDHLKVSLNSPKSKLVDEDLVISCANSNFYVPTTI